MEEKIPNRVSARYVLITIDEKQRRPVTRTFGTTRVPLLFLFTNQQKITLQQRHAATTLLHKSRLIFASMRQFASCKCRTTSVSVLRLWRSRTSSEDVVSKSNICNAIIISNFSDRFEYQLYCVSIKNIFYELIYEIM